MLGDSEQISRLRISAKKKSGTWIVKIAQGWNEERRESGEDKREFEEELLKQTGWSLAFSQEILVS